MYQTQQVADSLSKSQDAIQGIAGGGARDIEVNKDNVLQAAKVIADVADEHRQQIGRLFREIGPLKPGNDPVSTECAQGWEERLFTAPDSHLNRIVEYYDHLEELARNLAATARQYGYSEEEIANAFAGMHGSA